MLFISKNSGPIIEKSGKVRHFKGLDEKIPDRPMEGTYIVEFKVHY